MLSTANLLSKSNPLTFSLLDPFDDGKVLDSSDIPDFRFVDA
jgi:hypothetical protein